MKTLYNEKITEWIEQCTGRDNPIVDKPSEAYANFIPLTNNAKIKICDSIINLARQVFGPYGGYWIQKIGDKHNNVNPDEYVIKSKDGNEFFKKLSFVNEYAQVFLLSIQGYTKYIADARTEDINQTSKDGTTSTALLSAAFSKFLLIELELMKARGINHRLPSTMYNLFFDVLNGVGSQMIADHAVKVYDDANNSYIDGFEQYAINAVNTTIDSNPVLSGCFNDFMQKCKNEGINILNVSQEAKPKFEYDTPKVVIEMINGVKFAALKIDELPITKFQFKNTPFFIFDGFIEDGHVKIFMEELKRYLTSLANTPLFTPDLQPVIFLTRTPDKLIRSLANLSKVGQLISYKDANGNNTHTYIKPVFFQIMTEFEHADHYKTIKDIFSDNVVDLNAMNHYIIQQRKEENMYDESNQELEFDSSKEHISLQAFYPNILVNGIVQRTKFDFDRTITHKKGEKTYSPVLFHLKEIDGTTYYDVSENTLNSLMGDISFEGSFIRIDSSNDITQQKISAARIELTELRKRLNESLTPMAGLDERIDYLTASTIRPIIYSQTASQQSQLITLYNDALGVFASVHKDGVMPGANTFFLKYFDLFKENVYKYINEMLQNVPNEKKEFYMIHVESILNAMYNAYAYIYSFIDDNIEHLKRYQESGIQSGVNPTQQTDLLTIYNVVSGRWEDTIIEPACTTKDVFRAMLNIAQDFILINSIQITSKYDQMDAIQEKTTMTYHPINLDYAPSSEIEKYSLENFNKINKDRK